nr:acetate kinase [Propionibacterium sp.]
MSMPILLLNAGSSSIKYQVIDAEDESVLATGLIERIGEPVSAIKHKTQGETFTADEPYPDHTAALRALVAMFDAHGPRLANVKAVGHRTVHGGSRFDRTVRIDDDVIQALVDLSPLAPLHNPPGIAGIRAAQEALPNVPHFAIFDTAFFAHLPAEAYTYAIDKATAERLSIRRYGFHGTSHNFVSQRMAHFLGRHRTDLNMIVCHLGNGASVSAIKNGIPIETSMGLTPLQGLVMGTRSGDIDPGIVAYLHRSGMEVAEIDALLNKKSGMLGLCGKNDFRDIAAAVEAGDADAKLAFDVYIHRLVFYIGGYMALLGGVDAIAFTAGVGENDQGVRAAVCERLAGLGFHLDPERNALRTGRAHIISTDDSPVTICVVPTNEELQMAREVNEAMGGQPIED